MMALWVPSRRKSFKFHTHWQLNWVVNYRLSSTWTTGQVQKPLFCRQIILFLSRITIWHPNSFTQLIRRHCLASVLYDLSGYMTRTIISGSTVPAFHQRSVRNCNYTKEGFTFKQPCLANQKLCAEVDIQANGHSMDHLADEEDTLTIRQPKKRQKPTLKETWPFEGFFPRWSQCKFDQEGGVRPSKGTKWSYVTISYTIMSLDAHTPNGLV